MGNETSDDDWMQGFLFPEETNEEQIVTANLANSASSLFRPEEIEEELVEGQI